MDDQTIRETLAALDRALARIALKVAGSAAAAEAAIDSLARGQMTPATQAFLAEAGALIRARRLLADAVSVRAPRSLRKVA